MEGVLVNWHKCGKHSKHVWNQRDFFGRTQAIKSVKVQLRFCTYVGTSGADLLFILYYIYMLSIDSWFILQC